MRQLLLIAAIAALSNAQTIDKLVFLSGCWAGNGVEEMWTKPLGGTMMGLSRTVKANKTVFTEFLYISSETGGAITLNVQLRLAAKSTQFRATEVTENSVTFSNPAHDYPQRIMYRRQPDGTLFARIEGTTGGKQRHDEFRYSRTRCPE